LKAGKFAKLLPKYNCLSYNGTKFVERMHIWGTTPHYFCISFIAQQLFTIC